MAKKPTPAWYVDYVLKEARCGNPHPLIARLMWALQSGERLSDGEFWFIVDALEATTGKKTAAELRDLERWLIAQQVDGLVDEEGMKPEQAKDVVAKDRNCSPRKISAALKVYGKTRRYRG